MSEELQVPAKSWDSVETLKEAKFEDLVKELKDIDQEIAGLESRKAHARTEIEKLVQPLGFPVDAIGYRSRWHPESFTTKLDPTRLVAAGVTPDQIEAATVKSPKKAYLEIRKVK